MSQIFATKFEQVCDILDKYDCNPNHLIAILQEIQHAYSYLPEDILTYVATALRITPGAVYGVATFYAHFTLEPKGKYVIRVCDGTACHVKKSETIINMLKSELRLPENKNTTEDLLFTLEIVACLGACGIAPLMMVNDEVYGSMTKEKLTDILSKIREEEAVNG